MNDVNFDDFKNICRTCMTNCGIKLTPNNVILDLLNKLSDINFETNDELPQQICVECLEKLNEIHEFSLKCKHTHSSLIKCLNNIKNEQTKKTYEIVEKITIEEHKIKFVEDDELKSENDQNTNHFEENSFNINVENVTESSDEANPDDLNENIILYNENVTKIRNKKRNDLELINNQKSMHSGERSFECEQCSKSFNRSFNLKRHLQTHTNERPFKCKYCPTTYKTIDNLRHHMRTHSGVRLSKCKSCSKSFKRPSELKEHMREHNDERPYKCDKCPKRFIQNHHLKQHLLTHPVGCHYFCPYCHLSFTESIALLEHKATHTEKRPYQCSECDKSFARKYVLTKHLLIHGDKKF